MWKLQSQHRWQGLCRTQKDRGVTSHVCMCDFDADSCRERGKNKVCQDWHSIHQRLCKPQTFTLAVMYHQSKARRMSRLPSGIWIKETQSLTERIRFEFKLSRWLRLIALFFFFLMNSTLRLSSKPKNASNRCKCRLPFQAVRRHNPLPHTPRQKLYWFQPSEAQKLSPWRWTENTIVLHYLHCTCHKIQKTVRHLSSDNLPKMEPAAKHSDVLWEVKGMEELSCCLGQKEAQ